MINLTHTQLTLTDIQALARPFNIRCNDCGQFISRDSIVDKSAKYHFIPDNQFGPEESYWICKKCKN